jgi:hypothetical protein
MRIRQSHLGDFDACGRKMQYKIEDPRDLSGSVRAVGNGYHAGLELYYNARMAGDKHLPTPEACGTAGVKEFDTRLESAGDSFLWDPEKFTTRDEAHGAIRQLVYEYFDGGHQWPLEFVVLGVEISFTVPIEGSEHVMGGTADLVLQDPMGGILGVDHKTAGKRWPAGKHEPRKNNQAPWYVKALQQVFPGAPYYRFVFDVMTYGGVFERRIADPDGRHIEAITRKAIEIATVYEGMRLGAGMDLPANPGNTLCNPKWCDHFDVCPYGRALEGKGPVKD